MKLVDLVVEVRFEGMASLLKEDLRFKLAKKITPKAQEQAVPGVDIVLKEMRVKVAAESSRYAISVQDRNEQKAVEKLCNYTKTVNNTIDYSGLKIARIGIRTSWVHKVDSDFDTLASLFREKFYQTNDIVTQASDYNVSLTFDLNDDFKLGYMAGPIRKNEQLSLVTFPVNDLNSANVFISADYFALNKDFIQTDDICQLIVTALAKGKEVAETTVKVLEV